MKIARALDALRPYAKAVAGFVAPGVAVLVAALQDGSPGGTSVVAGEWAAIVGAMIVSGSSVYAVPNRPARGTPDLEHVGA